jgi:hypothetical protein
MTPGELLLTVLCYCGVALVVLATLAVCCLGLVGFVLFSGWLASTFKATGPGVNGEDVVIGPNGMPMKVVNFPGGQRGTVPFPYAGEMLNGRPLDPSEVSG